jgi:hypothetical protein
MPNVRILALVATAALAAGVSACGGEPRRAAVSELSTPTVSEPAGTAQVSDPARARYVRQVDRVCAHYNPRREQAMADAEHAPGVDNATQIYDTSILLAEKQLHGIEAIAPPSADRQLIASNVIDRLRQRIVLRRALRNDLIASDADSAERHRAQLDALTIALQSFARGYGFRTCGAR